MKFSFLKTITLTGAIIAMGLPSMLQAQARGGGNPIDAVEIKPDFVEAPRFVDTPTTPNKWLQLDITFTPAAGAKPSGAASKAPHSGLEWLDDVTVQCQLLYPISYQGKNAVALFKTKTVLWSLPMDGKKHKASFFVPPQVLQRYARPEMKENKAALKDIDVFVVIFDKDQRPIGAGFYTSAKGTTLQTAKQKFETAETGIGLPVLKLDSEMLPREKTPWQWVDTDSFDLIKSDRK